GIHRNIPGSATPSTSSPATTTNGRRSSANTSSTRNHPSRGPDRSSLVPAMPRILLSQHNTSRTAGVAGACPPPLELLSPSAQGQNEMARQASPAFAVIPKDE